MDDNDDTVNDNDDNDDTINIGIEAIPRLKRLITAMREGDEQWFDLDAIEWAEFVIACVSMNAMEDKETP